MQVGGYLGPHRLADVLAGAAQPVVVEPAVVDAGHRAVARVRFIAATVALAAGITKDRMLLAVPGGAASSS